jgi:hypothetical protein
MSAASRICAVLLAAGMALTSCSSGDDTAAPAQPGPLMFSLTTPAADDGIILVTVKGPGLSAITAARSSYRIFSRQVDASELRIIVQGQLTPGPLFSVQVPDTKAVASYSSAVVEVASVTDVVRTSTAGYSLAAGQ